MLTTTRNWRTFIFCEWVTTKTMNLLKYSFAIRKDYLNWINFETKVRDITQLSLWSQSLHHACSTHPVCLCGVISVSFLGGPWIVLHVSYSVTGERSPFSCGEWVTPPIFRHKSGHLSQSQWECWVKGSIWPQSPWDSTFIAIGEELHLSVGVTKLWVAIFSPQCGKKER